MRPLTFNPGPSKISPETYAAIESAVASGFLELSHRNTAFYEVSDSCIRGLKEYLHVPPAYHVLFLDSATSAWHSIVANVVEKNSFHFINGAFSKKAYTASEKLYKNAQSIEVPEGQQHDFAYIEVPKDTELVTACYNESSSGTVLTHADVTTLRKAAPDALIAIDATSAAAAIHLPIESADIWYFSVQKGFGLPAGLGVLILSPRAYERSLQLEERKQNLAGIWRWSAYVSAQEKQPGQTIQTPNMLGIYLLNESVKRYLARGGIDTIEAATLKKAERVWKIVDAHADCAHFVKDAIHRSPTVITVAASEQYITELHERAKQNNVVLGKGYGELKPTTFRVANFPAITEEDIDALEKLLEE